MEAIFWWVIFPYLCGTTLILGTLYRFVYGKMGWVAPSTEFLDKRRWLRLGSHLFHWGIIFAFIGHVMGILIPKSVYDFFGITEHMYHVFAIFGGSIAGLMVVIGLIILLYRKWSITRLRVHATFSDYYAIILLLIVAGIGTYMTLIYNTTVVAYEYRTTIGPWFRSLLTFRPQYELMTGVPFLFQLHVITSFVLFASIPFTKLVHMFSFPGRYPARAPMQYRSRDGYSQNKRLKTTVKE